MSTSPAIEKHIPTAAEEEAAALEASSTSVFRIQSRKVLTTAARQKKAPRKQEEIVLYFYAEIGVMGFIQDVQATYSNSYVVSKFPSMRELNEIFISMPLAEFVSGNWRLCVPRFMVLGGWKVVGPENVYYDETQYIVRMGRCRGAYYDSLIATMLQSLPTYVFCFDILIAYAIMTAILRRPDVDRTMVTDMFEPDPSGSLGTATAVYREKALIGLMLQTLHLGKPGVPANVPREFSVVDFAEQQTVLASISTSVEFKVCNQ